MSGPVRLSEAQKRLLLRAQRDTYEDESGNGALILDGIEFLVAERLDGLRFGRLSLPRGGAEFGFLKITPAGRAALRQSSEKMG